MTDALDQAAPEPVLETAPVELTREQKIQRAVMAWAEGQLFNSPLSRATDAWNFLQSKLPLLASFIEKEL